MKLIRNALNGLALVAGLFLFALVVDRITPLNRLDAYLRAHPQPYTAIALVLLLAGILLLAAALASGLVRQGRPMEEEAAKDYVSWPAGWQVGAFRGRSAGREMRLEASFSDVKDAFSSGAWLHDPGWWPICFGLIGLTLAFLGGFGFCFIVGAPAVKVLVAVAMLYAIVRTIWGFAKA